MAEENTSKLGRRITLRRGAVPLVQGEAPAAAEPLRYTVAPFQYAGGGGGGAGGSGGSSLQFEGGTPGFGGGGPVLGATLEPFAQSPLHAAARFNPDMVVATLHIGPPQNAADLNETQYSGYARQYIGRRLQEELGDLSIPFPENVSSAYHIVSYFAVYVVDPAMGETTLMHQNAFNPPVTLGPATRVSAVLDSASVAALRARLGWPAVLSASNTLASTSAQDMEDRLYAMQNQINYLNQTLSDTVMSLREVVSRRVMSVQPYNGETTYRSIARDGHRSSYYTSMGFHRRERANERD